MIRFPVISMSKMQGDGLLVPAPVDQLIQGRRPALDQATTRRLREGIDQTGLAKPSR